MPMQLCIICRKLLTSRPDGYCDWCAKARKLIEESPGQALLAKIILDCEDDWRLMDRIDNDCRRRHDRDPERP